MLGESATARFEVVDLLYHQGMDMNAPEFQNRLDLSKEEKTLSLRAPLHLAAEREDTEMVRHILSRELDMKNKYTLGRRAVNLARTIGLKDVDQVLILGTC